MKTEMEFEASLENKNVKPCPPGIQESFDGDFTHGERVARHGDLFLHKCDALPPGAKPVEGRVVLRATEGGNTHGVRGAVALFDAPSLDTDFGTSRYLVVSGPAEMALHLEHGDAPLPVGVIEARRKREGRGEYTRWVMD